MRKESWTFLVAGFIIGFAVLYVWTKQRAPEVVRAIPLNVETATAPALSGPPARGSAQQPAPPVDMARVEQLQAEIKNNPRNYEALVELANIHYKQKNFQDAIAYYSKALEIRPGEIDVRTDLGTMLFYANRYDEAINEFKKVLAVKPDNPQTLFNIGVAMLHGKNDPQAALQYWEKLVETNPNYPEIGFVKEQIQALKERQKKQ